MIYLDNAATTAILPEVADTMNAVIRSTYGNPSSIHQFGRAAAKLLRESREVIAQSLSVSPSTITFTAGASESNNMALISYALANRDKGNHIITTTIEHPSVLHTVEYLHDRYGFDITFVKPMADGRFTTALIANSLRSDTILVSMMHANNETGQLLPVSEIGAFLKQHQAVFHVDATQTIGKIPINLNVINCDFLSASAHKFHGPKGIGFLYHSSTVHFDSFIHGGEQEEKHRAGTENIAGIVGMAKALEIANNSIDKNYKKVQYLHDFLLSKLTNVNYYQNTFGESLPHILNLGFSNENHDLLLTKFDLANIAISTGSACTAGTVEPSHVLAAVYGTNSPKLKENIRLSFSELNTENEINQFVETLKGIL